MDNKKLYSPEDLEQPIVKLAEELDRRQVQKGLSGMTEGKQAGFGKTDCENVVEEQKRDG